MDYNSIRRKTRKIFVGRVPIGGKAPVVIQSMTKTDTRDITATIAQIKKLEAAGCEIVRVAVPDREAAEALKEIKANSTIPVIADIHFDHKLALLAVEMGIDGLRINPGNIGPRKKVREVTLAAAEKGIPIRIGVNSGSLEKEILEKYGGATPEAMAASALRHIRILEDLGFLSIKVSLKASDIFRTVKAYELLAEEVDYPFHAGITESGSLLSGTVKSSIGLGILLQKGLADTIRVSLTAQPEEEVFVGRRILAGLEIRKLGPEIVSCPICGRCEVDNFMDMASDIEQRISAIKKPLHVAVMGCVVNGPGEAREADIGLACGRDAAVIFKKGKLYRRLKENEIVDEFVMEVFHMAGEASSHPPR